MSLRMPSINQVALCGRLVQDAEFRLTEAGMARLGGRIVVNRSYRDAAGLWQEETSYFSVTLFGGLAEALADRLLKGTPVFVSGRLRSHTWRDDQHNPHSLVEIVARYVQVLEGPPRGSLRQEDIEEIA